MSRLPGSPCGPFAAAASLSRRVRKASLGLVALTVGCVSTAHEERCRELDAHLVECFGEEAVQPVACDGTSDLDLTIATSALDAASCDALRALLPIDGDYRSARCRFDGAGCVEPVNDPPRRAPTRFPIVLVNGIDDSPLFRWSDRIVRTLEEDGGQTVRLATLTPWDAPHRRAAVLWERIGEVLRQTGAEKVNLVCHSLGGLDCRYLASPRGLHREIEETHEEIVERIASITTVSTAHRGTAVADVALGLLPGDRDDALDALARFFGDWLSRESLADDPHVRESLMALTESQALAFDDATPDADGILYQSWAGVSRPYGVGTPESDAELARLCGVAMGPLDYMALPLVPTAGWLGDAPNDGLCPVASAIRGEFRGCIPADHMEQLGQRDLPDANVRTGLDIAWFYGSVAADLAERGY